MSTMYVDTSYNETYVFFALREIDTMPTLHAIAKIRFPNKPGLRGAFEGGFRIADIRYVSSHGRAASLGAFLRSRSDSSWLVRSAWLNGEYGRLSDIASAENVEWADALCSTPIPTTPPFNDFRVSLDDSAETFAKRIDAVKNSVTASEIEKDRIAREKFAARFPDLNLTR